MWLSVICLACAARGASPVSQGDGASVSSAVSNPAPGCWSPWGGTWQLVLWTVGRVQLPCVHLKLMGNGSNFWESVGGSGTSGGDSKRRVQGIGWS